MSKKKSRPTRKELKARRDKVANDRAAWQVWKPACAVADAVRAHAKSREDKS